MKKSEVAPRFSIATSISNFQDHGQAEKSEVAPQETMLAGYVVERVSGQLFNDYIQQNIFKLLGMTHSTFA